MLGDGGTEFGSRVAAVRIVRMLGELDDCRWRLPGESAAPGKARGRPLPPRPGEDVVARIGESGVRRGDGGAPLGVRRPPASGDLGAPAAAGRFGDLSSRCGIGDSGTMPTCRGACCDLR